MRLLFEKSILCCVSRLKFGLITLWRAKSRVTTQGHFKDSFPFAKRLSYIPQCVKSLYELLKVVKEQKSRVCLLNGKNSLAS